MAALIIRRRTIVAKLWQIDFPFAGFGSEAIRAEIFEFNAALTRIDGGPLS